MTHPTPELLSALVDDELSASQAHTVREHLAACARCTDLHRSFARAKSWAPTAGLMPPPAGEWESIRRAISAPTVAARPTRPWASRHSLAAALILVVLGSLFLARRAGHPARDAHDASIAQMDSLARSALQAARDTLQHAQARLEAAARSVPNDPLAQARRAKVAQDSFEFERIAARLGGVGQDH